MNSLPTFFEHWAAKLQLDALHGGLQRVEVGIAVELGGVFHDFYGKLCGKYAKLVFFRLYKAIFIVQSYISQILQQNSSLHNHFTIIM